MRNPTLTIDNDRPHLSTGISFISDLAHDSAVQCDYHLTPIIGLESSLLVWDIHDSILYYKKFKIVQFFSYNLILTFSLFVNMHDAQNIIDIK